MKIKCCVDRTSYDKKPSGKEVGKIQSKLSIGQVEIELKDLAELCANGCTFRPALLHGTTGDSWIMQQIFALDFDHDTTIEDQLKRCRELNILPNFGYKTFSHMIDKCDGHGPEERFRLIFTLPVATEDYRFKNLIQRCLLELFPKADPVTKDAARLFFGGKSYFALDTHKRLDPFDVILKAQASVRSRAEKNGHYSREIRKFAEAVGVNLVGNCLDFERRDIKEPAIIKKEIGEETKPMIHFNEKLAKNTPAYINNIGDGEKIANFVTVMFNISHEEALSSGSNIKDRKKQKKYRITAAKTKREKRQRRFSFDGLYENCRPYAQATDGEIWCTHQEIFGMATNLQCVEGGEGRMLEIIQHSCYEKQFYNLYNTIKYVGVRDYEPSRCEKFCPYAGNAEAIAGHTNGDLDDYYCYHKINMLQMTDLKRLEVRKINELPRKDIVKLSTELERAVKNAYDADDSLIYVIKAPTGIGKTEILTQLELYNTCIAGPTHKLGNELSDRLDAKGKKYTHIFQRPALPHQLESLIDRYQKIGEFGIALNIIESYLADTQNEILKNTEYGSKERSEEMDKIRELERYLQVRESAKKSSIVLCTHEKLFSLKNPYINKVIIDEDIIQTALLKIVEVKISEIEILEQTLFSQENVRSHLGRVIDALKNATSIIEQMPTIDWTPFKKDMQEAIRHNHSRLSSNIIEILNCNYFIKDIKKNKVHAITTRQLDRDKKYIIMSATANEMICKQLFGERLRFIDLGHAEMEGEIILHPERGYSRSYLFRNQENSISQLKGQLETDKIITYKGWKPQFESNGLNG